MVIIWDSVVLGAAAMILRVFKTWADNLAADWLDLAELARRRRRFGLSGAAWPFLLQPLDGAAVRGAGIEIAQGVAGEALAKICRRTRGSLFEVTLPPGALLERELEPLPAESEPYVETVVMHQLEKLFPWSAGDILHSTLVERRSNAQINVRVRATSRSAVEPALSIATTCGASRILLREAGARDGPIIELRLDRDNPAHITRTRSAAGYAIIAFLIATLGAGTWTSFVRWTSANELAALDRAIGERRALFARLSASRDSGGPDGLEGRIRQGPLAVELLERLSELLPDDTYVTDLSLEGNRLRILGISGTVTELVPLLEKSGYFRSAAFYAPTTRIPATSTDRFSIEVIVTSSREPTND
jgi:general secretion pathway protein L